MTRFIDRPEGNDSQHPRICTAQRVASPLFQGWGPKL